MLVKSRLYLNFKFSYSPVPPPLHLHFWISGLEKVSLCSKMLHNFHQFKESLNRTIKKFHILRIFLRFYNLFGHRISTLEKQPRTSVFFTSILFFCTRLSFISTTYPAPNNCPMALIYAVGLFTNHSLLKATLRTTCRIYSTGLRTTKSFRMSNYIKEINLYSELLPLKFWTTTW